MATISGEPKIRKKKTHDCKIQNISNADMGTIHNMKIRENKAFRSAGVAEVKLSAKELHFSHMIRFMFKR